MVHFPLECGWWREEDILCVAGHAVRNVCQPVSEFSDARGGIRKVDVEVTDALVEKCRSE